MAKLKLWIVLWTIFWEAWLERTYVNGILLYLSRICINRSSSQTIRRSPFEVVYGRNQFGPLDLIPLPTTHNYSGYAEEQAKCIKDLHGQVRDHIIEQNEKYHQVANNHRKPAGFKEGDLVWIHLRKENFSRDRHKFKPRADVHHLRFFNELRIMHIRLSCWMTMECLRLSM